MPDMRVEMKYTLALTKDELTLVQRALRCVLTDEEKPPALALQEALLLQRAKLLDQMANEADKAAENIEKARATGDPGLPHVRRLRKEEP